MGGALKVVAPLLKSFKDCQEFLVVDFVVKLHGLHPMRVRSNRVQVARVGRDLRNNGCDGQSEASVSMMIGFAGSKCVKTCA